MSVEILNGDCCDLLRAVPDRSVDLVLCDPPYGTTQNKWDSQIPLDVVWREIKRVLKPRGTVVLTGQGPFTARLIMSNERWFKYKIVWEKSKPTNFLNAKKQPLRKHEDILVFAGATGTYNPQMQPGKPYDKGIRKDQRTGSYRDFNPAHIKSEGGRYPTDIIYFKTAESEGAVLHPTQKPVGLMEYLVLTYSNPGDVVLDFAMGSGSTGVACQRTDRSFVGIEKYPHIFAIAAARLQDMPGQCAAPEVALPTRCDIEVSA